MKTKFLRLSAVAIVVVALLSIGFFSACTNEDDFNSNSSSTTFNKKNAIQGDENRPYPEYEMKDFSDSETKSMLEEFNEIVNDPSSTISDMSIEKALYIMEAYINYGVIDKANSVAKESNTEDRTFTFTVPVNNGKIVGRELKDIFQDFAVNLLTTMRGKAIPLSDMYVKDISSTSVTFGLDITPFKVPLDPNTRYHFHSFYSAGDVINVPAGVESPWGQWFVDGYTQWGEQWPAGGEVTEHNVYRYSQKSIHSTYSISDALYYTYYTGLKYDIYSKTGGTAYTIKYNWLNEHPDGGDPTVVYYDNEGIANILIPAVLNRFPILYNITNQYMNLGDRVLCDYTPKLYNTEINLGENSWSAFCLYVSNATFGFKHVEQPVMHYITAFRITDIYPEL